MSYMKTAVFFSLLALVAGCATQNQGGAGNATAPVVAVDQRPIGDQPATNERRANAKLHAELGAAYLESGRPGVALDEARVAIAYDNTYALGHLLLAQVNASLEQFDQAKPAFEEAARLAPGDPEVNNAYGWFLCSRGQEKEGLARLESATRNPYYRTPTRPYTNAGLCHLRLKNDVAAEQNFLRAHQADNRNLQAKYHLAAIAYRNGNYLRAREWINDVQRQMNTPSAEVLWLGLRIERKLGNRQAESDYAFKLRRDFVTSDEYQQLTQGKFE